MITEAITGADFCFFLNIKITEAVTGADFVIFFLNIMITESDSPGL